MTREEALGIIRKYNYVSEERAALETLIPELCESEDERIRKWLIRTVRLIGVDKDICADQETMDKAIAWLEKQKEQKPAEWSQEECGRLFDIEHYLNGTLQLSTDRKIACIDFLKSLRPHLSDEEIKKIRSEEYTKGFNDAAFGGQLKEWSEEDENALKYLHELIIFGDAKKFCDAQTASDMRKWLNTRLKSLHPQPKQQWSEEDSIGWDEAFACVTRAEKAAKNEEELQNAVSAEKWLKEIKFKYYVHPIKQGWSEEEKQKLNRIYSIIGWAMDEHAFSSCKKLIGDKEGVELQDFLRSIAKPKAEWSKEDEENLGKLHRLLVICQGEKKFIPSDEYDKLDNWLKSLCPVKKEWSEEDEKMRQGCIDSVEYELLDNGRDDEVKTDPRIVWLKSLRPQPKREIEWTEDDEAHLKWLCRIVHSRTVHKELSLAEESELGNWMDKWLNHSPQPRRKWSAEERVLLLEVINDIKSLIDYDTEDKIKQHYEEEIAFLKSLRSSWKPSEVCYGEKGDHDPAGVWKPSEKQMNALNFAITYFMHETSYKNPTELRDLYEDLAKLKGGVAPMRDIDE